jgi:hypothetical protein
VDFDFFANNPFTRRRCLQKVRYLKGAAVRRSELNTLTVTVERGSPVQVSFFGGLGLGQVEPAGNANGPGIKVASLVDLAGCKVAVGTGGQNHQGDGVDRLMRSRPSPRGVAMRWNFDWNNSNL